MRRPVVALLLVLLAQAAAAETFTLRAGETVTIEVSGVTAAYAVDPAIADVTAANGRIVVTGRAAGTTQVMAITGARTQTFSLTVGAALARVTPSRASASAPAARAESRYSSGARQWQNSVDVYSGSGASRSQLHVLAVRHLDREPGRSRDALPSVFYRSITPGRVLTLLDDLVDLSPLSVRATQIRGLHLQQGGWELHGGYAASTLIDDLFLPADRRWMGSAAYSIDRGAIRWTPSLFGVFSAPDGTAARRGLAGSLAAEHRDGDALYLRGEVSVSRDVAAAAEARYDGANDHLHADLSWKPEDFPTLGLNGLPGGHAEGSWSHRAGARLSIDSYGAYERLDLANAPQSLASGSSTFRYLLTKRLALGGGADVNVIDRAGTSLRTIGLPLSLAYDTRAFGLSATYRLIDTNIASRRGDTLRLSARASAGDFRISGWIERQRQAPTLDLIFRAEPGLERALFELGLSVRSPEDLARALRDSSALVNLGYIEGVTVNFSPRRTYGGFDLAWNTPGGGTQLRLHAIAEEAEGVRGPQRSMLATLTASRQLGAATEVFGSYSRYQSRDGASATTGSSFEAGVRQRLDGVPALLQRSGSIEGVVFLDPAMNGMPGAGTTPLEGIAVMLDGITTVRSDRSGAYAFRNVPPGTHRVAAQLAEGRPAYFTTRSHAEVEMPARLDFGLLWASARVIGRVTSDAGEGVAGVNVTASAANGTHAMATSNEQGAFTLDLPPGGYTLSLAMESLPPGFALSGAAEMLLVAKAEAPQTVTFQATALRSITGVATAGSVVRLESLGRTVTADAQGRFAFRSLPAGALTITAAAKGRTSSRTLLLPNGPVIVSDVVLDPSSRGDRPIVAEAPHAVDRAAPGKQAFRVQLGAYRVAENARVTQRQARQAGYEAGIERAGALEIVSVGPFPTRAAAAASASRLNDSGLETAIVFCPEARHPSKD
jgi:hypothetical protein